jgi:hypothetical protein
VYLYDGDNSLSIAASEISRPLGVTIAALAPVKALGGVADI